MAYWDAVARAEKLQIPISATFEITHNCNLNCGHCYIARQERKEFSTAEVKGTLRQLAKAGSLFLLLTGGEARSRKDFFEIASYAESQGFAWSMISNGTLIDEEKADRLGKLNPYHLTLSIYGMRPGTHDRIVGVNGSWERTMHAIELLKERKLPLSVQTLVLRDNFHEIESLEKYFEKKKVKYMAFTGISPKTDGSMKPLEYALTDKQLAQFYLARTGKVPESRIKKIKERLAKKRQTVLMCAAGESVCMINPYGDVFPCISAVSFKLGNIRRQKFSEIWHKSPVLKKFRRLRDVKAEKCGRCGYKWICERCLGEGTIQNSNLQEPYSEACRTAKARAYAIESGTGKKYLNAKGHSVSYEKEICCTKN